MTEESPPSPAEESGKSGLLASIEATVQAAVDACFFFVVTSSEIGRGPVDFGRKAREPAPGRLLGPFSYVVVSAFCASVVLRSLRGHLDRLPLLIAGELAKISPTTLVQTTIPVLLVVVVVGSLFSKVALGSDFAPSGTGGRTLAYAAGFQFVLIGLLGIVVQLITRLTTSPDGQRDIVSGVTLAIVAIAAAVLWPAALLWGAVSSIPGRRLRRIPERLAHALLCIIAAVGTLLGSVWAASWGNAPTESPQAVVSLRPQVVYATNADGALDMQAIIWNDADHDVWLAPNGHSLKNANSAEGDLYDNVVLQIVDGGSAVAGPVSLRARRSTLLWLRGRLVVRATKKPARGALRTLRGQLSLARVASDAPEVEAQAEQIDWAAPPSP